MNLRTKHQLLGINCQLCFNLSAYHKIKIYQHKHNVIRVFIPNPKSWHHGSNSLTYSYNIEHLSALFFSLLYKRSSTVLSWIQGKSSLLWLMFLTALHLWKWFKDICLSFNMNVCFGSVVSTMHTEHVMLLQEFYKYYVKFIYVI